MLFLASIRRSRVLFVIASLVAVCLGASASAVAQTGLAARVNDDVITVYQLDQRSAFAARQSNVAANDPRVHRQILNQMIDERLQAQDAKRNGITVSQQELRERIQQIEQATGTPPGQLRAAVEASGMRFELMEEQIRANLLWIKTVRRRIVPQIDVSDAEISDALRKLKENVGKQETRVAEIFMAVDRPEHDPEVRRNADRVMAQIRAGASFSTMAQQFSQSATASVGGDIGWVLPGSLDPAIDRVIEKLGPRTLAPEPIRSAAGWHIIYVIDRRPVGRTASPDEIRVNVMQMILPLPANATEDEAERRKAEAQTLIAPVKSCADLRKIAFSTKGASYNDISDMRAGDMPPHIRDQLLNAPVGSAIGPFRLPSGVQVLGICSRQSSDGLPSRESLMQSLRVQKIETAARRYMRDLRRNASIDISLK